MATSSQSQKYQASPADGQSSIANRKRIPTNIPSIHTSQLSSKTNVSNNNNNNNNPTSTKVNNAVDNSLNLPSSSYDLSLKRTSSSTSTYIHDNEFLIPEGYTLTVPWKRIGAFVDVKNITEDDLIDLSYNETSNKLTTYIYEKYYADLYWNCSLIIGCCFGCWAFSFIGFGFFSFVFVSICTFAIYRAEFRRFNINIRDDMQRIQSKENLQKNLESMEWLNNFLSKFWVIYMPALSDLVISNTNSVLNEVEPPTPINKLTLDEFTLGTKSPKIESIKSFTKLDKNLYQMDWSFNFSPNDVSDMTQNELKNKIDPKIALGIRIGKGFVGASLPILVENMSFIGNLRIKIQLGDTFPHVDIISICFLEPPKIDYALKPVGGNTLGIDVMSVIPGLSSFVNGLINSNLAPMMYYPNTIDINLNDILKQPSVIGVLDIKIRGAEYISRKKINPYIKFGVENDEQFSTDIKSLTTIPIFNESKKILINNLNQKLKFELFNLTDSGDSLSLGELFFELQDLLQNTSIELKESKFVKNNRNVGKLIYDLNWHPVLNLDDELSDSNVGIIEFNLLSTSNLDNSKSLIGKLSTYAEIFIDDKLINTSRIIKGTNNPEFKFRFENLIYNKNNSILKIKIKDISSFKETTIAEFESKILDLTLIDNFANSGNNNGKTQNNDEKITIKNFTKGKGKLKFTCNWKPLDSISENNENTDNTFIPPIGIFKIDIIKCDNLPNIETLGTIDPYVKILSGGNKVKGFTTFIKDSHNPIFDDERFYISILSKNQSIKFDVLDYNKSGENDRLIGSTFINLNEFFNNKDYQNKNFKFSSQLNKNGKKSGTISYSLTYYPLLNLYSHSELANIKNKTEEVLNQSEDLDELEEQKQYLEDYKKHPNDYEWVDIDRHIKKLYDENKIILSLDELININSGILGINLISGKLKIKNAFIEIFIDDHNYPDFVSRKCNDGKVNLNSGDSFIRDLQNSILNIRIVKKENPKFKNDILYETIDSFKVIDLLKNGYDKPIEINLDDNKLKFMFEYVPILNENNKIKLFESIEDTGILNLNVIKANNLIAGDRNGKSDPYIVGFLNNRKVFKTETIKKTLNPEFNENFKISIKSRSNQKLNLKVYDWDMTGDNDFLGEFTIDLNKIPINQLINDNFKLDTQGFVNVSFKFLPGYLKASGELLSNSSQLNLGLPNDLTSGAAGMVTGAAGVATGAVGNVAGVATGVATGAVGKASGLTKNLLRHKTSHLNNNGMNENNELEPSESHRHSIPHLSLKPSFIGNKSRKSTEISSIKGNSRKPSLDFLNTPVQPIGNNSNNGSPSQLRIPSSPGVINNGNYKTRNSIDEVSIMTTSFNGTNAISGRLTILEVKGFENHKESINIKTLMKSAKGTEKTIYKTKNNKSEKLENEIKINESVAFKCESNGSIIFVLRSHHKFGKDEELAVGEVGLAQVIGVKEDIEISMQGKIACSLVVNFHYA